MQDRVPLYPGRVKLTPVSGQSNIYDMERADQPTIAGTPLNKTTFLTDAVAELYGLTGSSATINDVLSILTKAAMLNSDESAVTNMDGDELLTIPGVQIATGSYVGTGTYGSSNPCTLTFDFVPILVVIRSQTLALYADVVFVSDADSASVMTGPASYQSSQDVSAYPLRLSWTDNTLAWYSSLGVDPQLNTSNRTYLYVAFG